MVEERLVGGTGRLATFAVLALAMLAYTVLAVGYAMLTPMWQNPDEPAHYNYVAYVAQTGSLPTLQAGDWDSTLLERLKNGRLEPDDSVSSIRYESWQPPLFYLLAAPLFRLGPTDDPAVQVFRLRLLDVVLGGFTVWVAYLTARDVLPGLVALAVPLVLVGIPMFTSVSAAISADPLANLVSALMLLVLVRRWGCESSASAGPNTRWAVGAGVLLGLGLLTKLALGIFVPLALLTLSRRSRQPVRESAFLLGACGLVVVPWLIHQVTSYGWVDPLATARHAAVVLDQPRFPGWSLPFLGSFLTITFHSFWAQFGWMGVVAPDRLYWIWGAAMLAAFAGLAMGWRKLHAQPAWVLVLATLAVALLAYIGYNLTFQQPQGRYLFTALVPIAMLLVAGWANWLPSRLQPWGVVLVGLGLLALNAYALTRVLVPGFAPTG